jgi:MATE family multidrug resistance protein
MSLIPLLIFYQFADAMQICYANILRGTGRVMSMMRIAIISYVIIGLPAAYILGFTLDMGVKGIFLAISLGLFIAAGLFFREYHKLGKTHFS